MNDKSQNRPRVLLTSVGAGVVIAGGIVGSAARADDSGADLRRGSRGPAEMAEPFSKDHRQPEAPRFQWGGPPPDVGGDLVGVAVDTRATLGEVPSTLFGNNAAVWQGSDLLSLEVFDRLKVAGVSILRFPGGSTSDTYHFDGNYPPYAVQQGFDVMSQTWAASTAEFMYLVRRLGATPLITVNHGYASYDTTADDGNVQNAARLAADWVEYCNAPHDGSNPNGGKDWAAQRALDGSEAPYGVKYWEIGNETYGFWEQGYDPVGDTYAENFNVIADAMKAVDPSIYIGIVTQQLDYPPYPWSATVLSHPGTAERVDFLVHHNYFQFFTDPSQPSASVLLEQASQIASGRAFLDDLVANVMSRPVGSVPYYLGEYNATIPNNPLHLSLVNGLFITKVLGELAREGFAAASIWDVVNGYDDQGLGPGDHGFLSREQPGLPNFTPRPSYYPFYFYTHNFGDRLVDVATTDPGVVAYAGAFHDGELGVLLVNESDAPKAVELSVDAKKLRKANLWVLTGDSLDAQSVALNGQGNGRLAGGPPPETVPPYALKADDGLFSFSVPPASVSSLVLH